MSLMVACARAHARCKLCKLPGLFLNCIVTPVVMKDKLRTQKHRNCYFVSFCSILSVFPSSFRMLGLVFTVFCATVKSDNVEVVEDLKLQSVYNSKLMT